jgi:hypothetical protein
VLWTAEETEAVVAGGVQALITVGTDRLLPEVAAALRKDGRLLRWMAMEALPQSAWEALVELLRGMLLATTEGSHSRCKLARQLLSEVLSPVAWPGGCCAYVVLLGGVSWGGRRTCLLATCL